MTIKRAGIDSYIGPIIGSIIGLIPLFIFIYIFNYEIDKPIYQKTKIIFGNTLGTIINIFLTILYFILAITILFNTSNFIISQYLTDTPITLVIIILSLTAYHTSNKGITTISKISLIYTLIIIILFIMATIGLIPEIKLDNLKPVLEYGIKNPIIAGMTYSLVLTIPISSLLIIPKKEIENYYTQNAEGLSFETIVASGENSSKPHAVPTDRKIQEKDIITIDMGCKVNGYCSDMTRTIFVGEPTEEMKKIYDLVLNNQKFALDQYKDGANARQITKMVESNFKLNGGYDLIHSLGHGVGLEIHELPYMSYRFDTMLRENMVVTDEPGIYIPGKFGVRIEDTVQITKFGCISLTNSEKNYIII